MIGMPKPTAGASCSFVTRKMQTGNRQQIAKRDGQKTTGDKKKLQIQDIVPDKLSNIQNEVVNKAINPEFKTLFDVESNKEVIPQLENPTLECWFNKNLLS